MSFVYWLIDNIAISGLFVAILSLFVAFYSNIQSSRNSKEQQKVNRDIINRKNLESHPFDICLSSDIDNDDNNEWNGNQYNIPYTDRKVERNKEKSCELLNSRNILLYARAGMGKTREALELIHKLAVENGEKLAIIRPHSNLRRDFNHNLGVECNKAVLFIDNIDTKIHSFKELNSSLERDQTTDYFYELEATIESLKIIFDDVYLLFTSTMKNNVSISPESVFWEKYAFKQIPIPDIKKNNKKFINAVATSFNLKIEDSGISWIANNWDGTCAAITSAFFKVQMKLGKVESINIANLKYCLGENGLTYPLLNWKDYFKNADYDENSTEIKILRSITVLSFLRLPLFCATIESLTFNGNFLKNLFFKRKFKRTFKKTLTLLKSLLWENRGEFIFQKIYVEQLDIKFDENKEKNIVWTILKKQIISFDDHLIERFHQNISYTISKIKNSNTDLKQLIDILEYLVDEKQFTQFLKYISELYYFLGDLPTAKQVMLSYIERPENKDDTEAFLFYVKIIKHVSGNKEALNAIANSNQTNKFDVKYVRGQLLSHTGDLYKAQQIFEDLYKEQPLNFIVLSSLAIIKERMLFGENRKIENKDSNTTERILEIEQLHKQALKLNQNIPQTWQNLIVFYGKLEDIGKIKYYLDKFLVMSFDNNVIDMALGKISNEFLKKKNALLLNAAIYTTKKKFELFGYASDGFYLARFILKTDSENTKAKSYFEKGLVAQDFSIEKLDNTINNALLEKRFRDVVSLMKWLENTPHYNNFKRQLAASYFHLKKYTKAIEIYEQLLPRPLVLDKKVCKFLPKLLRCYASASQSQKVYNMLKKLGNKNFCEYNNLFSSIASGFFDDKNYLKAVQYNCMMETHNIKGTRNIFIISFRELNIDKVQEELFNFSLLNEIYEDRKSIYFKNLANLAFGAKKQSLVVSAYDMMNDSNKSADDWWKYSVCLNNQYEYEKSLQAIDTGLNITSNELEIANLLKSKTFAKNKLTTLEK